MIALLRLNLVVCFRGKLSLLPDRRVNICIVPHSRDSPAMNFLVGAYFEEVKDLGSIISGLLLLEFEVIMPNLMPKLNFLLFSEIAGCISKQ